MHTNPATPLQPIRPAALNREEPDQVEDAVCAQCGVQNSTLSFDLMKCSQCQSVRYCSRDCQRQHWRRHKKECVKGATQAKGKGVKGGEEPKTKTTANENGNGDEAGKDKGKDKGAGGASKPNELIKGEEVDGWQQYITPVPIPRPENPNPFAAMLARQNGESSLATGSCVQFLNSLQERAPHFQNENPTFRTSGSKARSKTHQQCMDLLSKLTVPEWESVAKKSMARFETLRRRIIAQNGLPEGFGRLGSVLEKRAANFYLQAYTDTAPTTGPDSTGELRFAGGERLSGRKEQLHDLLANMLHPEWQITGHARRDLMLGANVTCMHPSTQGTINIYMDLLRVVYHPLLTTTSADPDEVVAPLNGLSQAIGQRWQMLLQDTLLVLQEELSLGTAGGGGTGSKKKKKQTRKKKDKGR